MKKCLVPLLSYIIVLLPGSACFAKELKVESPTVDMIQGVWEGNWTFRNNSGDAKATIFANEALFVNTDRSNVYRYAGDVTIEKDEIIIRRRTGTRTDYYELFTDEKGNLLLRGQYNTSSGSLTAAKTTGSILLRRVGDIPAEIKSQGYLTKPPTTSVNPDK